MNWVLVLGSSTPRLRVGTSLWPVRNGVTAEGEQWVSWLKLHLLLPITPIANMTPLEPSPTPSMENCLPRNLSLGPKRLGTAALHGMREGVSRGRARGVACIAGPPLRGAECREQAQYPLYTPAPSFSEMAIRLFLFGWLIFVFLNLFGPEFASITHAHSYF